MDSVPALSSMEDSAIMHQTVAANDNDRTSEEDVCSICLDDFDSNHNPPTVTTCKHEFHLQCILEWSQRSKECPICWQLIVLKDPASQELLSMVEDERNRRSTLTIRHIYQDPEVDHDVEYTDSDFNEQVITTFEAAGNRRNRNRLSGVGPSQVHSRADVAVGQDIYTSLEDFHNLGYVSSPDNIASSSSISTSIEQNSPFVGSSSKPRILDSQSPNGSPGRPIAADIQAFSESVKSKFSAASAKYKESISKSTQGLKEKLLAKNSPVKELSRGVQREMSAGIAGVTKMFERLEPNLKRNNKGLNPNFFKGKNTQETVLTPPDHGNSAEISPDVSSNAETIHY